MFSLTIYRSKFIVFAASQNPTTENGKCVVIIKLHEPFSFCFCFPLSTSQTSSDTPRKQGSFFVSRKLSIYDPERVSKAKHYVAPFLLNLNVQMLATTSLVIVDLHSFWLNFKLRMTNSQIRPYLCSVILSDDDGSNNNVKKQMFAKQQLCTHARAPRFLHFLDVTARLPRETSSCDVCTRRRISFLFLNLAVRSLRILLREKSPTFDKLSRSNCNKV